MKKIDLDFLFQAGALSFFLLFLWDSRRYPLESRLYPQVIGLTALVLITISLLQHFRGRVKEKETDSRSSFRRKRFPFFDFRDYYPRHGPWVLRRIPFKCALLLCGVCSFSGRKNWAFSESQHWDSVNNVFLYHLRVVYECSSVPGVACKFIISEIQASSLSPISRLGDKAA